VSLLVWLFGVGFLLMVVLVVGGLVVLWGLVLGSPNGLMRQGWTRNSMKVGDVVTVEGSRAKDGSNIGNARTVMLNGKRMFAASSQGVTP
jgi:hypothetical protein